jgi:predicted MFS family arabinose efflux permease
MKKIRPNIGEAASLQIEEAAFPRVIPRSEVSLPNPLKSGHLAFTILFLINLFNYIDRQTVYAVLPLIQTDLHLSDIQAGWLASAFMIVYMFAALPIGYWADRHSRVLLISLGTALWSLATGLSAFCGNFAALFSARAAVGIGESCYGAISPSFICEQYPPKMSARIMALFSLAIPVGSALGYMGGGILGQQWGWRSAFIILGIPGLILAAIASRLKDPKFITDVSSYQTSAKGESIGIRGRLIRLFSIPSYALATLSGAAMTFALGGFAVWMPSFFHRQWNLSVGNAGILFGAITVLSGIVGTSLGGWASDRLLAITSKSYFLVSGLGLLLGMPLAALSLSAASLIPALCLLFIAEIFLFLNMGPLNAVIVGVTPLSDRSLAFGANMLVIHSLGDALSPTLIGYASERAGLKIALIGASLALGLAAAFCFLGMRYYKRDAHKFLEAQNA